MAEVRWKPSGRNAIVRMSLGGITVEETIVGQMEMSREQKLKSIKITICILRDQLRKAGASGIIPVEPRKAKPKPPNHKPRTFRSRPWADSLMTGPPTIGKKI